MSSRLPASTGSVSSQIDPATSIDQAKAGTRRRLMPSGRSDEHGRDHADGGGEQREDHHDPGGVGQQHALDPTATGAAVDGPAADQEARADQPAPERGGRRPGERHGGGPDLQGHDVDGEAEQRGKQPEEHHAHPGEGEDLEERVARQHVEAAEVHALHADQDGEDQRGPEQYEGDG